MEHEPAVVKADVNIAAWLAHSRYAQRLLHAQPQLATTLSREDSPSADKFRAWLGQQDLSSEQAANSALRRLRQQVMLQVMQMDLAEHASLAQVLRALSELAEVCVQQALASHHAWLAQSYGEPIGAESGTAQSLMVVAMGKLGGEELNASSDIDLIFVYGEEGETNGARRISNHEFFTLLGRKLIACLHEITAEGFVFRVDMRLRPYGESGPLVASLAMLENYFYTQARAWERYAWIKARALTGAQHEALQALVRPFVYRRYLDFAAIGNLRELHRQIREEVERRDRLDDIKLGRGGIREIEFVAQVFQLIRGGREPALQTRSTRQALEVIKRKRLIDAAAVEELEAAYDFLRRLEHRLQYLDDAQTQRLPGSDADRQTIAQSMGFASWVQFEPVLAGHRNNVRRHFESVFSNQNSADGGVQESAAALPQDLAQLGFADAAEGERRLNALRASTRYRQLPEASRARVDLLLPACTAAAARTAVPDAALARLLDLLESLSRRESYLAFLVEYPQALERLAQLMAWSPWAAEYVRQHPIVLDELLDPREFGREPDWPALRAQLTQALGAAAGDAERQMDMLRHFKQAQFFHLIAQDFSARMSIERLSDHLSDLADLILDHSMRIVWQALPQRHCDAPRFAVIGFGKLGGKELGYGSDLDVVFLYDDTHPQAQEIYARYAQRMNAWLNAYTAAGVLYETDLRLRPDGASGVLVSSVEAFAGYQREHAWLWEHQALTRARYCCGETAVGAAFEQLRVDILRQQRELGPLKQEIVAMREKMRSEHRNTSALFDVKSDHGGLIDVEFVVQYFVLGYAHAHATLTKNSGNIALLLESARLGLLPQALAEQAAQAYRELRRLQHQAWLGGVPKARVDPAAAAAYADRVKALWARVLG